MIRMARYTLFPERLQVQRSQKAAPPFTPAARECQTDSCRPATLTEPHDLPLAQPDSHRPAGMRMASIAARVSLAHVGDHGVPGRHIR
jgi:hypothetical protein